MNDNSEPAFPVQDCSAWQFHGLSMRDYFAAKALSGLFAGCCDPAIQAAAMKQAAARGVSIATVMATDAYAAADAMLEARKR